MFLSIKWKALTFLSIILFFMASGWLYTSVQKNLQDLQNRLEEKNNQQQSILNQMIEDDFLKIAQFAQLIAKSPEINHHQGPQDTPKVQTFLDDSWFYWNINLSVDYIAVLKEKNQFIADISQYALQENVDEIRNVLKPYQELSMDKPLTLIFCRDSCMQLAMEPFLYESGEKGVIVLGQNMSELVFRFAHLSGTDLAILLDNKQNIDRNSEGLASKVWSMSHFKELMPQLTEVFSGEAPKEELALWNVLDREYFYKELAVNEHVQLGSIPIYLTLYKESERIALFRQEIQNAIMTSLLVFLISEIVLWFLLLGPLRRLVKVVSAQSHLPEREYDKAISLVSSKKRLFRDELTSLEQSTLKMAAELKHLDHEISISNEELAQKINQLTRSKDFLQRLFDNSNLLIVTLEVSGHVVTKNDLFSKDFVSEEGRDFAFFFVKKHEKMTFREGVAQLTSGDIEDFQHETTMLKADKEYLTVVWTHALVNDEVGHQRVLSIGVDITQRKKDEEKLFWIANHDSLTNIANRHAFHEYFNSMLVDKRSGVLIFIDINKFKQINDLYGHVVGDQVLIDVANKLTASVRDNDFVSRLSGDEFTVILGNVSSETLPQIIMNLWHKTNGFIVLKDGKKIEYDVSMGATAFPENGSISQDLIVQADMAMYRAKKHDTDKWEIFDTSDDSLQKMKMEQSQIGLIKEAIKDDKFHLVFQPTITLETKKVNHYESLLRLNLEDGSPFSPGKFIPLAERSGLIRQIDYWVIRHVYSKMFVWLESQPDLTIGINISAPTLQDNQFHQDIIEMNHHYKIPFAAVTLELTETAYVDDFANVHANLKYLHDMGFKIALDDFGVGYSSFNYLRQLPLNFVKLDGSYVNGVAHNTEHQAFIRSVVIMAEEFQMEIIAEFVENQEDLRVLKDLGVNLVQGYFIGRPSERLLSQTEMDALSQRL